MDTEIELKRTKAELQQTKDQLENLSARVKASEAQWVSLESSVSWVINEMAKHDERISKIFKELDEHERFRKQPKQGSGANQDNRGVDPNRYLQHSTKTNIQEFNPFMVRALVSSYDEYLGA